MTTPNSASAPSAGHSFHIPVMGTSFTIDTPLRVAHYGIASVVSIVDDMLIEKMREHYYKAIGEEYIPIPHDAQDLRARRICDYLNLLDRMVAKRVEEVRQSAFTAGSDIVRYFEMLPSYSHLRTLYNAMLETPEGEEKIAKQEELRSLIKAGSIDVNIMTKVDKTNYTKEGDEMTADFCDAVAALRGFALSSVESYLTLSAGINQRLFSFLDQYSDFFADAYGHFKKKIVLKVSDFRSALLQGKLLAKKGLWVWEYRIESGLNCGGHAFATDGYLMGPILEEFKQKRKELSEELRVTCNKVLEQKGLPLLPEWLQARVSVQGGVGNSEEHEFIREYYNADSVGWGSPFLLAPDVTNVDDETRQQLATAGKEDFYISDSSPLGVSFNNFRYSGAEQLRLKRIQEGRPGSPCRKKYLVSNTEFTEKPICTASKEYIDLKVEQLQSLDLPQDEYQFRYNKITEKSCLCEGLASSALLNANLAKGSFEKAAAICPGPNLAYFHKLTNLSEMVDHIYGRTNLLQGVERSHMFINELELYIEYLRKEIVKAMPAPTPKQIKYLTTFRDNLLQGIEYYRSTLVHYAENTAHKFRADLEKWQMEIPEIPVAEELVVA